MPIHMICLYTCPYTRLHTCLYTRLNPFLHTCPVDVSIPQSTDIPRCISMPTSAQYFRNNLYRMSTHMSVNVVSIDRSAVASRPNFHHLPLQHHSDGRRWQAASCGHMSDHTSIHTSHV